MKRVLIYDGVLPNVFDENGQHRSVKLEDIREMKAYISSHHPSTTPFDIIVEGKTPGDNSDRAKEIIELWEEAGATWWIESLWEASRDAAGREMVQYRLRQGPPN